MIVYNVTIKVLAEIEGEWLKWMQQEHIPQLMQTGCFESYKILKLLENDDAEGPTYAFQYFLNSMTDYNKYIDSFATALRQSTYDKWGDQFISFRTLMEVVQ